MLNPEVLLYDLWFLCPYTHVFVTTAEDDAPWEYEGSPEGKHLAVYDIRIKTYPNYGNVIELLAGKKED